jgi:regulator of protease activity HflC (stomatin/prohibitin superfamily)
MGYFGFIGILIVAFIIFIGIRKTFKTPLNRYFPTFLVLILIVVSIVSSLKIIPVGNVGIVFQFGNIIDQREAGLQIVYPWQDVKLANIMNQKKFF